MADPVGRLDEGPADIVVSDDAELEGDARRLRITERGGNAGVWNGNDHVRFDWRFARQFGADVLAHVVDVTAFDQRIRPGEIDIFEDTKAPRLGRKGLDRLHALPGDDDHLACRNVA